MDSFLAILAIGMTAFAIYFGPSIIAAWRSHHQAAAVFALNLFLGWTFLGWVLALVWSLTATESKNKE